MNPGATELCNDVDDNCDGVVDEGCDTGDTGDTGGTTPPTTSRLLHVEISGDRHAAYSVAVVSTMGMVLVGDEDADQVYGWAVNSTQSEDFTYLPTDAPDFTYTGDANTGAGYKITQFASDTGPNPWHLVCFSQDYWDASGVTDSGRIVCFKDDQITAAVSLTDANARFIGNWTHGSGYAGTNPAVGDFDGDGKNDLVMGGGDDGLLAMDYDAFSAVKTATSWPVVRNYPADADPGKTFTVCDRDNNGTNDGSAYCQIDTYVEATHSLIVTDPGYASGGVENLVESFNLGSWPPAQTGQLEVASGTATEFALGNMAYVASWNYLVGNMTGLDKFIYLDPVSLAVRATTTAPSGCEAYGQGFAEVGGTPYLWLGCPAIGSGLEGEQFIFDLTSGLPSDEGDAVVDLSASDAQYGGFTFSIGQGTDGGDIFAVANSYNSRVGTLGMDVYAIVP